MMRSVRKGLATLQPTQAALKWKFGSRHFSTSLFPSRRSIKNGPHLLHKKNLMHSGGTIHGCQTTVVFWCHGLFVVLGKQSLQAPANQVIHRTAILPNLRRFAGQAVPRQISALANFIAVHGAFAPQRPRPATPKAKDL